MKANLRRCIFAFLVSSAIVVVAGVAAQQASQPVASPRIATLDDFAWLAGNWEGIIGDFTAEQVWLSPKNGTMQGTFRLTNSAKTLVIELFTVRETPDGITFYFRHFSPELKPWEKEDATYLTLSKSAAGRIEFDNPVNNEPKNVIITRVDENTYVAHSDLIDKDGKASTIEVTYHRKR